MRPVCHPLGHVFDIFFISAKSNDISNIFVKSIITLTSIYNISMSPEHFEIKKQRFASLITVKISTVVAFGNER